MCWFTWVSGPHVAGHESCLGSTQDEKSGNPRSHAIRYTQGTPTEYKSKRFGTKRKAKAHKMLKKRKEDMAEDVAEVTWFQRT